MEEFDGSELYVVRLRKIRYFIDLMEFSAVGKNYYTVAKLSKESGAFVDIFNFNSYFLFNKKNIDYIKENQYDYYVVDYASFFENYQIFNPTSDELLEIRNELNGIKNKKIRVKDVVLRRILEIKSRIPSSLDSDYKKEIMAELKTLSDKYFEYQLSLLDEETRSFISRKDPHIKEFLDKLDEINSKLNIYIKKTRFVNKLLLKF